MSAGPVLIMAGGTGGHVFPALALARLLRQESLEVVWLGTRRGMEARIVPAESIPVEWVTIGGLRGKGALTLLAAPFRLLRALWQSLRIMRRRQPRIVVGLGGFVAGPGGVAAWLTRRPLLIHEQNAVAGFTNRCLAHLAQEVLEAFPGSFGARSRARAIGNPVRADIAALPPPAARFAGREGAIRMLVIGGSQGAVQLNRTVPEAIARLSDTVPIAVRHQAGERWIDAARASYAAAKVEAEVVPFIADMAQAYAWADIVVCRAGALTISELTAAGVGSILIPFPAAVDDHQTRNARFLVDAAAAFLIPESQLSAERLARELEPLCTSRAALLVMAERARALARPDATAQLAAACRRFLKEAA